MGCDIHFVIEEHCMPQGIWLGVATSELHLNMHPAPEWIRRLHDRNYEFFAELAGVRGIGPAPNGHPDDISEMTQVLCDSDRGSSHSAGWATLETFLTLWLPINERAAMRLTNRTVYDVLGASKTMAKFKSFERANTNKYRVVFWFDNKDSFEKNLAEFRRRARLSSGVDRLVLDAPSTAAGGN